MRAPKHGEIPNGSSSDDGGVRLNSRRLVQLYWERCRLASFALRKPIRMSSDDESESKVPMAKTQGRRARCLLSVDSQWKSSPNERQERDGEKSKF